MNFAKEDKEITRLCEKGWADFLAGGYQKAWEAFEAVLLIDTEVAMANSVGGACLLRLGQQDEAERLARAGVQLSPEVAIAHYFLAEILSAAEKYDEAEAEFWEAIALEPYNDGYRITLGRFFISRDRDKEGVEQFQKAVDLAPENGEAHLLLGIVSLRKDEFGAAEKYLETAIRLEPEDNRALAYAGVVQMIQAHNQYTTPPKLAGYQKSVDCFRRALTINPENEIAKLNLPIAEAAVARVSKPAEAAPVTNPPAERGINIGLLIGLLYAFRFEVILAKESRYFWPWVVFIVLANLFVVFLYGFFKRDFSFLPLWVCTFLTERFNKRMGRDSAAKPGVPNIDSVTSTNETTTIQ